MHLQNFLVFKGARIEDGEQHHDSILMSWSKGSSLTLDSPFKKIRGPYPLRVADEEELVS